MKKQNVAVIVTGALVAAATAIFFIKKKSRDAEGKPPKNAPQLNIENPGDQSEFTTSASASEMG